MAYESIWNHRRDEILEVIEDVKASYPQAWQAAHNPRRGDKRQREEFCQRVCMALRAIGIPAGMNGKRGNPNDLSEDIIALPNVDSKGVSYHGAVDTSGRFRAIEIRDIIASAGPDENGNQGGRPVFGDVTQATIDAGTSGCYVEPTPQEGQPQRPPTGGEPTVPPVTSPIPPPATDPGLEARVAHLEQQFALVLSGIGAVSTAIGTLDGKLFNEGGVFDELIKRLYGVADREGLHDKLIQKLRDLPPDERDGALEGCRVVKYLRERG